MVVMRRTYVQVALLSSAQATHFPSVWRSTSGSPAPVAYTARAVGAAVR
jgi:hypothetical protein